MTDHASQYNVAIGNYTLSAALEEATSNTAVGHDALKAVTTGDYNTALGEGVGRLITTGSGNVLIGRHTGDELVGGNDNVMMGYAAGHRTTGNSNVLIGYLAGDNLTTGANNTGIGANVAFDIDADNQTCVGNGATTASTGANTVVLGNAAVTKVYMASDGAGEIYANGTINTSDRRLKRKH